MEARAPLSFFSNKNINIYPKSPTFISDQVIYQWKEERKKADWNESTEESEKRLIHPYLLSRACWEAKFKSKSELLELITVTVLKANRLWDFNFFLMSPLQSTNVMDKGQTHYSWVSICLVQMQRLTRETSSKGQCPGLCAPRLMYVRHTQGSSLQHLSPKAKANHGGF